MDSATAKKCEANARHRAEQYERLAARATELGDTALASLEHAEALRHTRRADRWHDRARELQAAEDAAAFGHAAMSRAFERAGLLA